MRMLATLELLDRSMRRSVTLPATVRHDGAPINATISDLSATGFRAAVETELEIGSTVGVGWANGGRHEAVVVRRDRDEYGFEFMRPVGDALVANATALNNVIPVHPGPVGKTPWVADFAPASPDPDIDRWSGRARVALVAGASVSAWGLVAVIGWTVHALVA